MIFADVTIDGASLRAGKKNRHKLLLSKMGDLATALLDLLEGYKSKDEDFLELCVDYLPDKDADFVEFSNWLAVRCRGGEYRLTKMGWGFQRSEDARRVASGE